MVDPAHAWPPSAWRARIPWGAAASLLAASLLLASPAAANGRYPAAGLIVPDPSDPDHLVIRATYGVLSTRDRGGRWDWICEGAVGYGGFEDPMIAALADGTLVAGLFKGLSSSTDGGCGWSFAGGSLADRYVTDLSADRADPSRAVLVVSNGVGAGTFLTQLFETGDSGASWTQAGVDLPPDFLALTVDTAPSDPSRVYVSGRFGAPDYFGAIERSSDRGQTWERLDIPGTNDQNLPFLSAVDPADPDVIYVRVDGDPSDILLVSADGGQTFTTAFTATGNLLGFALSPDGATVLVGGEQDGLWSAPAATLAFEKIADISVRCLTWLDSGLLACADEFADGFTAGASDDGGRTFTPILHLDGVCGPLACDASSNVASICTELWPATELTLNAKPCDGGGGGGGAGPVDSGGEGGCGCRVGAPADAASLTLAWGALAAVALRRARRRPRGRLAPHPSRITPRS